MKRRHGIIGLALAAVALPALAQVGVPQLPVPVQLPRLPPAENPLPQLPLDPAGVTNRLGETLQGAGAQARKLEIRELLRRHRDVLEADPEGEPIVRGQVGALAPSEEALAAALAAGFTIESDRSLEGLGLRLVVLRAPEGLSTRRALKRLREADPEGSYDYNHVYLKSGSPAAPQTEAAPPPPAPRAPARIGMIDSGVNGAHPALAATTIHRFGCEGRILPGAHGTAVASLLAGEAEDFRGSRPGAVLYAADVFCGEPAGGSVALMALGLDWLARERVAVVNISLVGSKSVLMTGLVRAMVQRGHLLVASVGNDGPSSPPLYPAAYPGVVGVTGVDAKDRVLPEACRGPHVAFAAPGADMRAAGHEGGWLAVRGTSFATPIVAGLLADGFNEPDPAAARGAVERLSAQALDLGKRGQDKDYGKGLVGGSLRNPLKKGQ